MEVQREVEGGQECQGEEQQGRRGAGEEAAKVQEHFALKVEPTRHCKCFFH